MIGIRNTDNCATNRTNQFVWIIIKINVLFSMFVESEKKWKRNVKQLLTIGSEWKIWRWNDKDIAFFG